jgi:hypothetical protein
MVSLGAVQLPLSIEKLTMKPRNNNNQSFATRIVQVVHIVATRQVMSHHWGIKCPLWLALGGRRINHLANRPPIQR